MTTIETLLGDLAAGRIEVIDLTAPLSDRTTIIQLPPPFANTDGFQVSTSGGNTAVDANGYRWNGNGSLVISAIPVVYSGATIGRSFRGGERMPMRFDHADHVQSVAAHTSAAASSCRAEKAPAKSASLTNACS